MDPSFGPSHSKSVAPLKRLAKGRKARARGELVQIDTLFVNLAPDKPIKHFTAYDPIAKWTMGHVSTEATANAAKALLAKLLAAPLPVRGIQVDGGAEFMALFEEHCRTNGLELVVLPHKRPDLNGAVERAQFSWRYEFYASYDLPNRIAAPAPRRRLRPSLQSLQAPPGPWRQNSSRVSQRPQFADQYVVNSDSPFPPHPRGPILKTSPARAAMAINGHRNKSFGPGGGTRRLHPSPLERSGLRRGRNRFDGGSKG